MNKTDAMRLLVAAIIFAACGVQIHAAENSSPNVFDVCDFGAIGDGKTMDTAAIQKAVDACTAQGGGQVLLPGGKTFLTGAIVLRSNVDFHLARGAVLKGSEHWQDFGDEGALLFAKDASNISISGDGILDGNDKAVWQRLADEEAGGDVAKEGWWPQSFCGEWWPFGKKPGEKVSGGGRPMMILLIGCKHARIRDITIHKAPSWTIHPAGCDDLVIESISILNDWNVANNDGIDPDHCKNVRIANCYIDTADDGIVLKNTPNFAAYGACENITVTGCVIASRSCALKLDEAYAPPGIRNVVFDACVIFRSNRGLCIQSRDAGDIENVIFSNITIETQLSPHKWWGAAEPIHISHFPRTKDTKLGHVSHIRFSNILCRGENGVYIHGWESDPVEDVVFDNVRVEVGKSTDVPGGFYDGRPDGLFQGIYTNNIAGIHCEYVRGLTLRDTQVVWGNRLMDYYGPALDARHIENLQLENFSGKASQPGKMPDQIIE
jgi:polygalacturonase